MRQKIEFPQKTTVAFKDIKKTERHPFIIYADFEAALIPSENVEQDENSTHVINTHEPSGYCLYTVSTCNEYASEPIVYSGPGCMDHFFDTLLKEQQRIAWVLGRNVAMLPLTDAQQALYDSATVCMTCGGSFTPKNYKVHHHDHKTGLINGPCHRFCNLQLKPSKRKRDDDTFDFHIPVVFHNAKNYDSHFIIKYFDRRLVRVGDNKFKNVKIVASSCEKFIAFDIHYLRIIDSVQFLSASLDTLVKNLHKAGVEKFIHTRRHMGSDESLFQKGVFPYEWFDDINKLNEKCLPPIEKFYSKLNDENISNDDYLRAQKVFSSLKDCSFKGYHDHYMTTDVLLLADIFEEFRTMCLESYELDPAYFLTLPSFAWCAMLKLTGVELKLITDMEQELFISSNIRGGISVISHRHAKGNNPYLEGYNRDEPNAYLLYLDCNNLYGASMSEPLPYDDFNFLTETEILRLDYLNVPDNSAIGYILEVDLIYPEYLHDLHNDYPLAPESLIITEDMLSPFCKSFAQKHLDSKKLVPNLRNKTKYTVHYRNLKLYVELGMIVTKIHRVLSFSQKPWMKPYIDFNTEKRKNAKNDFEKELFKLLNNSVYGKTLGFVKISISYATKRN